MKSIFIFLLVTAIAAVAFAEDQKEERRHRGPPRMNLTEEQKTCLHGQIGEPGEGERPSREVMEAAFTACGIEKPQHRKGRHHRRQASEEEGTAVAE